MFFGPRFTIAIGLGLLSAFFLIFFGVLGPTKKEIKAFVLRTNPKAEVLAIRKVRWQSCQVDIKHENGNLESFRLEYKKIYKGKKAAITFIRWTKR